MRMLMPCTQRRLCVSEKCGHTWTTAYPGPTACAVCGEPQPDLADEWPHVCSRGHAAYRGGACESCIQVEAKS